MIEILHKNWICRTDGPVTESPGRPVLSRSRSVVCPCLSAGVLASPGYEEEVKQAWATRNGYDLDKVTVNTP